VEGVEELLLHAFLAGEELDVVDDDDVELANADTKRVDRTGQECPNQVVREGFRGEQRDAEPQAFAEGMRHRACKVRLAEPDATVEEERVVAGARMIDNFPSARMGERIALADDEALEAVAGRRPAWRERRLDDRLRP